MSAAGDKILASIRESRAILRGERAGELVVHVPAEFNVKALRRKLGMSQSRFAKSFGFRLAAVQSWEQGRRRPEGPALACDLVIMLDFPRPQRSMIKCLRDVVY